MARSVVRTRIRGIAPIAAAGAAGLLLRAPRAIKLRSPVQWAACILTAGAVTRWLASDEERERSRARYLLSSMAGAAASFLIVLPRTYRSSVLTSLTGSLLTVIILAHVVWGLVEAERKGAFRIVGFQMRLEAVFSEIIPAKVARLAAAEATVFRYLFVWRAAPVSDSQAAFAYHGGGVLPLLWTVAGLSVFETAGMDLLVRQWSKPAAIMVSVLSELGVIYLIGVANSLRCLPVIVDREGLTLRLGLLLEHRISWNGLSRVELIPSGASQPAGDIKVTTIMPPNVRLTLTHTMKIKRLFKPERAAAFISIYVDRPEAFLKAVEIQRSSAR